MNETREMSESSVFSAEQEAEELLGSFLKIEQMPS